MKKRQKVDATQKTLSFLKPKNASKKLIETGEVLSFLWEEEKEKEIYKADDTIKKNNKFELYEEKYKPLQEEDIIGQNNAMQNIKEWKQQLWKNKPLLLGGPSGSGKSSLIKVLFNSYKIWNESFLRDDESLLDGLKILLEKRPLFDFKRCIVVDCLEGLQSTEINEIIKVIQNKKEFYSPFILICDDEYEISKDLVKLCHFVKTQPTGKQHFFQIIKNIVDKEELTINNEMMELLFDNCSGNIRFALNELQFLLQTRKRVQTKESNSSLFKKDTTFTLFPSTQHLFSGAQLTDEFLSSISGENEILSKMIHENAIHIQDFKFWEYISIGDLLEYKNDDLSCFLTSQSTSVFSKKMNFNGPRKLNFPSYYAFDAKRLRNESIKKKSGLDKLPLQKWVSL